MYNDLKRLLAAVSMATGRGLDPDEYDDRMTMQKGCYILNSWGYGPRYRFDMYVRGPYSSKLADDFCTLVEPVGCDTNVSGNYSEPLVSCYFCGVFSYFT